MALKGDELEQLADGALVGWADPEDAFEEVYERFRSRLFRFCYSRLGDAHEAEDVTQETFARIWKTPNVLADPERCYPWLRVVARNLCTDLLRRRGRCQPQAEIDPGEVDGTESAVLAAGDAHLVRLALGRLNVRHRIALEQREESGWTYEQMAADAGTTVSSIESLLWRARQALKRELLAVAGPDGMLAGLPVIGLLVRKWHGGRLRVASWLSQWVTPSLNAGTAVAAAALGSCAAACVATASGLLGPAPSAPPPTPSSHTVPAPAGMGAAPAGPATVAASPGPSGSGPSAPAAAPTRGGHDLRLQRPVTTGADNNRDRSMPVSAGVGTDTLGADPVATAHYATGLLTYTVTNTAGGRP